VRQDYLKIKLTNFSGQSSYGGTQSKSTAGAMLRKARVRAVGRDGEAILNLLQGMMPQEQDEWIKSASDEQLDAIVSTPDPSGIDVRHLTDEQLEAIINGKFYGEEAGKKTTDRC
jgi:hypothetical protein